MINVATGIQQGTYHKNKGLPCQDYALGINGEKTAVIALADGAGSYENSEIAAEAVVRTVVNELSKNFDYWYRLPEDSFKDEFIQICKQATNTINEDMKAVCTLLLYACDEDDREIIVHIGDGYIFGSDYYDEISVVSYPENGDEPNQTFFLADLYAKNHLRIIRNEMTYYNGIMLCSDGAAAALIDRSTERYAKAIGKLIRTVELASGEEASAIIESTLDTMFRVHSADDMSIAIMTNTTFER